jgi:hypothetical protein
VLGAESTVGLGHLRRSLAKRGDALNYKFVDPSARQHRRRRDGCAALRRVRFTQTYGLIA